MSAFMKEQPKANFEDSLALVHIDRNKEINFQEDAPLPLPGGSQVQIVVNQPTISGGNRRIPQVPVNCPPGLEYLSAVDQLLVHQKVEVLEVIIGFETKNKYAIKNSLGQKVYYAAEDTDCLTRCCCGPIRPFDMKIFDNFSNEVIHLYRPLACDSCCCPCCLQSLEVYSPPGTIIGVIEQEWKMFGSKFSVKTPNGETVLIIRGPVCPISCCNDVNFYIKSVDDSTVVGKICKQWTGLLREAFTDADHFGITFPIDMDVRMKAVLLGACFLIDFMFFETSNNNGI